MKKFLTLFLAVCMLLTLCACVGGEDKETEAATNETDKIEDTTKDTETDAETAAPFTVKVVDGEGNAVAGVMLQICKDSCIPARTDDNGVATFNIEVTSEHKLSVLSCPEGYEYTGEAEVYLESGISEYTVELNKVA